MYVSTSARPDVDRYVQTDEVTRYVSTWLICRLARVVDPSTQRRRPLALGCRPPMLTILPELPSWSARFKTLRDNELSRRKCLRINRLPRVRAELGPRCVWPIDFLPDESRPDSLRISSPPRLSKNGV
jgi:hypothetical protein